MSDKAVTLLVHS